MKWPTTSHTLIGRIRKGDETAWSKLLEFYAEPIKAAVKSHFLRWTSSSGSDLGHRNWEDTYQSIMAMQLKPAKLQSFNESKARFRTWLQALIQNQISSEWRRDNAQKRNPQAVDMGGTPPVTVASNEPSPDLAFDLQLARQMVRAALDATFEIWRQRHPEASPGDVRALIDYAVDEPTELKSQNIGELFGAKASTVRSWSAGIRKDVREAMLTYLATAIDDPAQAIQERDDLLSILRAQKR